MEVIQLRLKLALQLQAHITTTDIVGLMSEYAIDPPIDLTDPFGGSFQHRPVMLHRERRAPEPRSWHEPVGCPAFVHVPSQDIVLGGRFQVVDPPWILLICSKCVANLRTPEMLQDSSFIGLIQF
jgi:hypothetical protein